MKKLLISILSIIILFSLTGCDFEELTELEEKNFTHEITKSYKDKYNISYYIEGTLTNNNDKDYSYVQIEFICYDKKGNNLGTALDNTNNLLGKQTWKFKAMAMFSEVKNVDHCDYHDITAW